jgi:hypothetical protein
VREYSWDQCLHSRVGHIGCQEVSGRLYQVFYSKLKFFRSGCCRCSLPCPGEGFIDKGPMCYKAKPYQTNSYSDLKDCHSKNQLKKETCVDLGMGSYTERCDPGFIRSGRYTCLKTCPVGWPDEGEFCTKIGQTEDSMPFPWMPGDPKA